jgi:hypothetical protein
LISKDRTAAGRRWALAGAAVVVCVVLMVVLVQRGGDRSDRAPATEEVRALAHLAPRLAEHFAIFRSPARREDALPDRVRELVPEDVLGPTMAGHSRLVARSGQDRVWALPGRRVFCLVFTAGEPVGYKCRDARPDSYYSGRAAATGVLASGADALVYAMLPDGVTAARLEHGGKVVHGVPIRRNGVLAPIGGADRLSWRGLDGSRHGAVLHTPGVFTPSVLHHTRPAGSVYGSEVGKDIMGTPYARVLELFGRPAHIAIRGSDGLECVYYRVVGFPRGWQLCFENEVLTGAAGFFRERDFPRFPESR